MTDTQTHVLGAAAETTRKMLTRIVIALGIFPIGVAAYVGNSILATAIGCAAIGGLCALVARKESKLSNIAMALGLVGQSMMFTAAFAGHPWQLDSHMAFFALIAATVLMVDIRAIIVASLVVVVHHVVLSVAMPALIYPSVDIIQNIERSLMHGAIVGLESAALIYTIRVRLRLQAQMVEQNAALAISTKASEQARQKAEEAMTLARENEIAAQNATQSANDALVQAKEAAEREQAQLKANQEAERAQNLERQRQSESQEEVVAALKNCLSELSTGNFGTRITEHLAEEYLGLRDDFNSAMENLETTFVAVLEDASLILHETTEISLSSDLLASRTEQQADTLAKVATSAKRLKSLVEMTAQSATNVSGTVDETKATAHRNSEIVGNAVKAMEEIEVSSRQIEKITGVIDEIAFQTNLLALNAGVEAARAGDAGRGFAVVASEVRSLAQRSSEAASEINALIARSGSQIETGVGLVNETGTSNHAMLKAIDAISGLVAQIAAGSAEQSGDVTEVSGAITQLDSFTQQNAAMFEETSAATKSLTKRTEELAARISHYVPNADGVKQGLSKAG